ncbi:AMP-binding protein [Pseudohoeflea coraliihabitans]|uniref:AMP-binding protein n=1 Tax=Pseudohoeflea coraliihabitans TaxID=2860393 RepID=A0ABS6WJ64_9HYPH|nr:AMP-binding protein [Pseudohoeflea sp. DP4N28-3]MBW3095983.1 AMP-binding protein [Pseudohoeflea sp. DP4N28-3]
MSAHTGSAPPAGRVLHYLLEERAAAAEQKPFLVMDDRSLTWRQADQEANRWANGLAAAGIGKGDRVLLMIPSGIEHVLIWLGICKIGAIMVPVNAAYRGEMLRHQVNDSEAALAIVAERHLAVWTDLADGLPHIRTIAVFGGEPPSRAGELPWTWTAATSLQSADPSPLPRIVSDSDPMAIFYTSGTTGPSKGVLYSHAQAWTTAEVPAAWCAPQDVFYMFLPMFHVGLSQMVGIVLIAGATMAIREKFSASGFWPDIRRYGVTMTILLSTMPSFLMTRPAQADDRDHPLRKVVIIPLPADLEGFKARFNIEVATWFNMTEVSVPLHSDGFNLANDTAAGRPRPGVTARIVDEFDTPLPPGKTGELVVRADRPWDFFLGYWKNPAKTLESWRNLWFHTGDIFRCDSEGNFYFVDRLKDAIRRRGENISSFEVEREIDTHPAVLESAAVAVPSGMGEDEIKAVVSLRPGADLTAGDLYAYLEQRLPAFMLPGFIELAREELPKTPTGKILKASLRASGTDACWSPGR